MESGEANGARLSMDEATRLALRLMLLTAQRKAEVINAEWADFDLDTALWTIPGEKAKNGQSHRVLLSPPGAGGAEPNQGYFGRERTAVSRQAQR